MEKAERFLTGLRYENDKRTFDPDLDMGILKVEQNKGRTKKDKLVKLIDEDIELFKTFVRGFPDLHFFRHEKGPHKGKRFGKDRLYANRKRACKNLNIEGVDLYGGTIKK